jgi:uncharacterized protein YbaR (Trm112 family)
MSEAPQVDAPENAPRDDDPPPARRAAIGVAAIDPRLLEILACPLTKTALEYDAVRQELVSRAARLAYPIRDGVPIMLADEARRLEE